MQILDDASKGPLGSIMIFFGHTALSLCSIGAVVVVLGLAYDPFVQQLVGYPSRLSQISLEATVQQAYAIDVAGDGLAVPNYVYSGLFGDPEAFTQTTSCPTGNCTWAPFQSVGWCSSCGPMLERPTSESCKWTLADLYSNGTNTTYNCDITLASYRSLDVEVEVSFPPLQGSMGLKISWPPIWSLNVDTYIFRRNAGSENLIILGQEGRLLGIGFANNIMIRDGVTALLKDDNSLSPL